MSPLHTLSFITVILLAVLQSAASTEPARRQVFEPRPDIPFMIASDGASDGAVFL